MCIYVLACWFILLTIIIICHFHAVRQNKERGLPAITCSAEQENKQGRREGKKSEIEIYEIWRKRSGVLSIGVLEGSLVEIKGNGVLPSKTINLWWARTMFLNLGYLKTSILRISQLAWLAGEIWKLKSRSLQVAKVEKYWGRRQSLSRLMKEFLALLIAASPTLGLAYKFLSGENSTCSSTVWWWEVLLKKGK